MKVLVYSSRSYDKTFLELANQGKHELNFTEVSLEERTALLAKDFPAVCCFVSDDVGAKVLEQLSQGGTRMVALRATGFNNVDVKGTAIWNR